MAAKLWSVPKIDVHNLAEAMQEGQLWLAYQPKVALGTGTLAGVEALARWQHPVLGNIPPCDFIPLAEAGDLMDPLTEWVLATAATDWAAWRDRGLTTNIAVNVSARNLAQFTFPNIVARHCEMHNMPCRYLTIELTESATLGVVQLQETLSRLRIKGISVSLDDFGTGYSSLLKLHQLPFSEIKIDQSFVSQSDLSKEAGVIVRSIVTLAHDLGLKTCAEGVENEAVKRILADCDCDTAQGYYFAKPMPAGQLLNWAP